LLWLDLRTENPKDRAKTLFFDSRSHQESKTGFLTATRPKTTRSSRDNITLTLALTPRYRAIPVTSWTPYTTGDPGKTSHFQPANLNQR